jgi:hypothetical protein
MRMQADLSAPNAIARRGHREQSDFCKALRFADRAKGADEEPARRNLNLGLIDVSKPLAKNLRMASFAYLREGTS